MTVVFGTPSAEHVTMTAGTPLSKTGRISAGSRAVPISGLRRRYQPGARARTGRLQIDLEHLELDGRVRLQDEGLQGVLR